jgi:hypothetical protein
MTFTTDKLRSSVRAKFTAVPIALDDGTEITLAPLTRLEEDDRKAVVTALQEFSEITDDTEEVTLLQAIEVLEKLLAVIASDWDALHADLVDDDTLLYSNLLGEIVQYWGKETRLGEA